MLIHVEGQTEEMFVNEVLAPHLVTRGYDRVSARLIGNARQRDRRGGIRPWNSAKSDIIRHLKQDRHCVSTTMVDFYGLPAVGEKAWPGRAHAGTLPPEVKGLHVQEQLSADIAAEMGGDFESRRFVPFVVVHEFEGLLFSDCAALARGLGRLHLQAQLQAIRDAFASPEEINDSPSTAPSKRITALVPGYQKPLNGVVSALEIGIGALLNECPHFRGWVRRLESIAAEK